eukprot:3675827-Amphidinium_carterae.1
MTSPFLPSPSTWLASHLLDYSLVSSNIYVYVNSVLELSQHPTITKISWLIFVTTYLGRASGASSSAQQQESG